MKNPKLRSFAVATSDVLLMIVGLGIILAPAVSTINSLLGAPFPNQTVNLTIGVLAVGGSYLFVAGGWSLGSFGEFVFAFVGCSIAAGVFIFVVIVLIGLEISGSNPLPQTIMFAVAFLVASQFI